MPNLFSKKLLVSQIESIKSINSPRGIKIKTSLIFSLIALASMGSARANLKTDFSLNLAPDKDLVAEAIIGESLPQNIIDLIKSKIGTQVDFEDIKISAQSVTWNDGCLGLNSGGICTMALVPGYKVKVTDEEHTWIFHTDKWGYKVLLASVF